MFFNNKYKKIISIFIVVSFLTPSLLLIQPQKTEAYGVDTIGGPSQVVSTVLEKIEVGLQKISTFTDTMIKSKEFILDGIAW